MPFCRQIMCLKLQPNAASRGLNFKLSLSSRHLRLMISPVLAGVGWLNFDAFPEILCQIGNKQRRGGPIKKLPTLYIERETISFHYSQSNDQLNGVL